MNHLSLFHQLACAIISLFGYPRTIADELDGRLLG